VGAGLTREEERDEHGEEHHVGGEEREDGKTNFVEQFAGAVFLMTPVVVAAASAAARRTPVNWGLAAYARLFPFRFRRGVRKGGGHSILCEEELNSLWIGRTLETMGGLVL
jgi:hypothetical protein